MSSSGVRRKRPSAPPDPGGHDHSQDAKSGSEGGGSGGVGAKCPSNPYEFDDDGVLSTQQQQMLRVLEQHKNLLNPKQQEVYEKLRRKASKANFPGFTCEGRFRSPGTGENRTLRMIVTPECRS